jgi:hypothetical protein
MRLRIRLIVAAAIRQDGMVCSVPRPGRHGDIIRKMAEAGISIPINGEQGFLTSDGLFVDRVRAKMIAALAEQIMPGRGQHRELFSEDVW